MSRNKVFAYILSFLSLVIAVFIYLTYIYMLGFPDGYLTELNRAEKTLFTIFIGINIILSGGFFYLGWSMAQMSNSKKLYMVFLLYIVSTIIVFSIDYYFHLHLDNGGGG